MLPLLLFAGAYILVYHGVIPREGKWFYGLRLTALGLILLVTLNGPVWMTILVSLAIFLTAKKAYRQHGQRL